MGSNTDILKGNAPDLIYELAGNIEEIFIVLDEQYKVLYWNKQAEQVTNITAQQIQNQSIYKFFNELKGSPLEKSFQKAFASKSYQFCEQSYILKGEEYIFQNRIYPCSLGIYVLSKDLTKEKRELKNQKRSTEFFQTVIDNIPVYLLKINPSNEVTWVNIPFQRMFGYSSEEIREMNLLQFIISDRGRSEAVNQFLNMNEHTWEDFYVKTSEGNYVIMSFTMRKLSDGSKIAIGQDISERKKHYEKINQLNQHINAIIENLPVVLFSTDTHGRYKSLMGMGLKRIKQDPNDLIGSSAFEKFGNLEFASQHKNIKNIQEALRYVMKGNMLSGNLHLENKYLNVQMVAQKDSDRKISGILGVALDITERYEAEAKLKATNQRLDRTLNSLTEAVFVIGVSQSRKIDHCNQAVRNIFGYETEELIGKSTRILHYNEKHFHDFDRLTKEALEKNQIFQGEYQMIRKDGQVITTEHTIQPLDNSKGLEFGVVSVVRDISDRNRHLRQIKRYSTRLKQLTRHLRKVQEEERAKIARDIHDETGQIFSIIKFNLNSLVKDLENSKEKVDVDYVKNELHAMKDMTNQAIQTTRRFIAELRPIAIDHMQMDEAIEWLINDFSSRTGIQTEFSQKGDQRHLNSEIRINIFRILQEALTNINKHSKADQALVHLHYGKNKLKLSVEDNGIGIDTKDKNKMNSYGLLGMQERVNDLEGNMTIEGKPNTGTFLTIQIPVMK